MWTCTIYLCGFIPIARKSGVTVGQLKAFCSHFSPLTSWALKARAIQVEDVTTAPDRLLKAVA